MQEDNRISQKGIIPVNFLVVRVKSKRDRLWEIDRECIELEAAPGGSSLEERELTRTITLLPQHDKKDVHYILCQTQRLMGITTFPNLLVRKMRKDLSSLEFLLLNRLNLLNFTKLLKRSLLKIASGHLLTVVEG